VRNPCRYDNQKAAELEEYARFQAEEEQRQSIIESERKRMLLEHAVRLMEFLPKGTLQRPEDLEMLLEVLMVRPALATLVGRALHLPSLTIHPADACCSPRRRGGERSSRRGRHSVDGATASLCHPPPSEGAHNQLDCKKIYNRFLCLTPHTHSAAHLAAGSIQKARLSTWWGCD
jgi:predicted RNA-binding Zn ribbon-like protein